ncbi:MAG: hypothetical protein U9O90_00850 [Euryarchaeota archaeon]|nr:hypothetical protein [Euryarchaeota archaeon]
MKIGEVLIEEGISEVYFGYQYRMGVYVNLSSDMTKLDERASQDKEKSI